MNRQQKRASARMAPRTRVVEQDLAQVVVALRQGRVAVAQGLLDRILVVAPNEPDALHLLGLIRAQQGDQPSGIQLVRRAIGFRPTVPDFHYNLGTLLASAGQLPEAIRCFRHALQLAPGHRGARNNLCAACTRLGNELQDDRQPAAALEQYREALAAAPDPATVAGLHGNIGNAMRALGRLTEAEAHLRSSLALQPSDAAAHTNLGLVYAERGDWGSAVTCHRRALELDPQSVLIRLNLGAALYHLDELEESESTYGSAVDLAPTLVPALVGLANVLDIQGDTEEALTLYRRAELADTAALSPVIGLWSGQLPILYEAEDEIGRRRAAYEAALASLETDARVVNGSPRRVVSALARSLPFRLAYQGLDDRDLRVRHGRLFCQIATAAFPQPPLDVAAPAADERIRVGFVSGHFRAHSVWKIPVSGWVDALDRNRFQVFGYHTSASCDAGTDRARTMFEHFVQGPYPVDRWCEIVQADRPHVLIYPEIGMDPDSAVLAALRLAPVQATSWGHPTTSGFPTLDAFLSSDLMEPAGAAAHYSESLVCLPGLGILYRPHIPQTIEMTREELGLQEDAVVYWCCQSLYKYLPQFDTVFPRIACAVGPSARFVFIRYRRGEHVNRQFEQRLGRAFAAYGLDASHHCIMLPRMSEDRFAAVAGISDVFLDSLEWSGCNTALESLHHDLPLVTHAGTFMRGRHTTAILRAIGVTETIAEDVDAFVRIAATLGLDKGLRQAISRQIASRKTLLFDDREPVRALEDWMITAVRSIARPCKDAAP